MASPSSINLTTTSQAPLLRGRLATNHRQRLVREGSKQTGIFGSGSVRLHFRPSRTTVLKELLSLIAEFGERTRAGLRIRPHKVRGWFFREPGGATM